MLRFRINTDDILIAIASRLLLLQKAGGKQEAQPFLPPTMRVLVRLVSIIGVGVATEVVAAINVIIVCRTQHML